MEDENGIELSLGLSCGGSAGKSKGKDVSSSDIKIEEGGSNNKSVGDFKNYSGKGGQRSELVLPGIQTLQENFFTNLAKSAPEVDTSVDLHESNGPQFNGYGGLRVANNSRSAETEEDKSDHHELGGKLWPEAGKRCKILFEDINCQKKRERETQHADAHGKNPPMGVITSMKTSRVSVKTEDGLTAENEDVAESEAEGSSSRLVSHLEDSTKRYMGGGGSSRVPKESHGFTNLNVIDIQGQKQSNVPPGNESKLGNFNYGIPFSHQQFMNAPYSLPNTTGVANASGFPLPCMMQLMPPANNERPGTQPMNPGKLSQTFGYLPVQLPTLDKDNTWGVVSHPQQFPPSYAGRSIGSVAPSSDKSEDGLKISQAVVQAPPHSSTEALLYDRKASELAKVSGKQHDAEESGASSPSLTENEVKESSIFFRAKEASDQPAVECFPHEESAIRPGVASGLKFWGCGSYPDLPWVSTKGPGPNGKTISGVTYRYEKNQIRIVCACHGSHMSPEEFVLHAGADHPKGLASFPSAASAHS